MLVSRQSACHHGPTISRMPPGARRCDQAVRPSVRVHDPKRRFRGPMAGSRRRCRRPGCVSDEEEARVAGAWPCRVPGPESRTTKHRRLPSGPFVPLPQEVTCVLRPGDSCLAKLGPAGRCGQYRSVDEIVQIVGKARSVPVDDCARTCGLLITAVASEVIRPAITLSTPLWMEIARHSIATLSPRARSGRIIAAPAGVGSRRIVADFSWIPGKSATLWRFAGWVAVRSGAAGCGAVWRCGGVAGPGAV